MDETSDLHAGLDPFLGELKSSSPTPGGGAVAGLCGALAGALTHMVASLTVGKKKYAAVDAEFRASMPAMGAAIERFRELMEADVEAFDGLMAAFRRPKDTDDEKARRKEAVRTATIAAAEVPLETLGLCHQLLPLVRLAAEKGNRNLVSDGGIAALLVTCAARSAAMNVKINLGGLPEADAEDIRSRLDDVLPATLEEAETLARLVDEKLG